MRILKQLRKKIVYLHVIFHALTQGVAFVCR